MRHMNNGGVINVIVTVLPRICEGALKGASSWRNTRVLSMLKIAVVIDHVTLNGAKYDPTFFVVWALMMGSICSTPGLF